MEYMYLFSFTEAAIIIYLICNLIGNRLKVTTFLLLALFTGSINYILYLLVANYFLFLIASVGAFTVLLGVAKLAPFWQRLVAVLIAVTVYQVIEGVNVNLLIYFLQADPTVALTDFSTRLLWFAPQGLITILIAWLLGKYRVTIFN